MTKEPPLKKPNLSQEVSSITTISIADRVFFHPFETVATYQQTSRLSLYGTTKNLYQSAGIHAFYRGFLQPFIYAVPSRLAMFASYRYSKYYLTEHTSLSNLNVYLLSGVASGTCEAVIMCPAELYRTKYALQQPYLFNQPYTLLTLIKHIPCKYQGFIPFLLRCVVGNTGVLAGADYLKDQTTTQTAATSLVAGGVSGLLTQFFSTPLDALKTAAMKSQANQHSLWSHCKHLYNNQLFYSSLYIRMLRHSGGFALMIGLMKIINDDREAITDNTKRFKP